MEVCSFSPTFVQRISGLEEDFVFNYNSPTIGKLIRKESSGYFHQRENVCQLFIISGIN